jgi:hypothetical protein
MLTVLMPGFLRARLLRVRESDVTRLSSTPTNALKVASPGSLQNARANWNKATDTVVRATRVTKQLSMETNL